MQRLSLATLSVLGFLSLGLLGGASGCNGEADYKKPTELPRAPALEHHDHGAKGPHGGGIVELGDEEYHAEVLVDHDAHALRVYLLGKDAKTAVATEAAEVTLTPEGEEALTLKAAPQKGDAEGKASCFELVNDELVHKLLDAGFLHGKLRIAVGDKPYVGDVDYHMSGDHDHKDEHKDGKKDEHKEDASKPEPAKEEPAKEEPPKEGDKKEDAPKSDEAK